MAAFEARPLVAPAGETLLFDVAHDDPRKYWLRLVRRLASQLDIIQDQSYPLSAGSNTHCAGNGLPATFFVETPYAAAQED